MKYSILVSISLFCSDNCCTFSLFFYNLLCKSNLINSKVKVSLLSFVNTNVSVPLYFEFRYIPRRLRQRCPTLFLIKGSFESAVKTKPPKMAEIVQKCLCIYVPGGQITVIESAITHKRVTEKHQRLK